MESRSEEKGSFQNTTDPACLLEPSYKNSLVFLNVLSLVLGQPMSVRLLWITLRSKHRDVLNCNLALFNLLQYCLLYVQLVFLFISSPFQGNVFKFVFAYVQVGGPMQLCFICLERFIAVIYPTYFPLLEKYRCREICAAVVWFSSISIAVLFQFSDRIPGTEEIFQIFPICLMVSLSIIMLFSSVKVAQVLQNPTVGKESIHPVKRRAFNTICVTCAVALACYSSVLVMKRFEKQNELIYRCRLVPTSVFFLSIASLVHPLLYLYAKREFCCKRCVKEPV